MNKKLSEEQKEDLDKHNIGNCSCLTKTPVWKYHKTYCAVWKNGKIGDLKHKLNSQIKKSVDLYVRIKKHKEIIDKASECADEIFKKIDWLTSHANNGNKLLIGNTKTYIIDQLNKIKELTN